MLIYGSNSVKPQIIFFGSGPVAAESLRFLIKDFEVEAVITKLATKEEMAAIAPEIPVHAVGTRDELDDLFHAQAFTSQIGVLIDFGIIVSRKIIDSFSLGIVNSHFSVLPEWRGADPITFAILSGQKTTGVSLMKLVEAMDEGPLLAYGKHKLTDTVTARELTSDLIQLSHSLLVEYLPRYMDGKLQPFLQSDTGRKVSYSRKLTKQDGIIDWSKPAEQIEREVRAFIEWPKSRTNLGNIDVVITSSKVARKQIEPCGKFWVENKQIFVSCGKDSLEILSLKPAGKNEMPASAFLAGYGNRLA